ncbi:hypothetical protein NEOLEDRAFT_1026300, partial [Neolentinus lepideus HHB14362 ss-1]
QTAYSLTLLSEYTHTLDSLPIDLSRNFADLRELDAVLSSSMQSVTAKVERLTKMIEDNDANQNEERLGLLAEIAAEAQRLKPGSDDKIRVACHAADNLRFHASYLTDLLEPIPNFDATIMNRKTIYPHVATKSYHPVNTTETGRRRRNAATNLFSTTATDIPAAKKRRITKDDDIDGARSPRKDKAETSAPKPRAGPRGKKNERAPSPTESIVSVASHIPGHQAQSNSKTNGNHSTMRNGNGANKRGGRNNNHAGRSPGVYTYEAASASHRKDLFNAPPSTSHPSLPQPYLNGPGSEWAHGQLEGPGMPVVRSTGHTPVVLPASAASVGVVATTAVATNSGNITDGMEEVMEDAQDDGKTYCICGGPSYGGMVCCDGPGCEKEWYHLACIGMQVVPAGDWFCDECVAKGHGPKTKGARGGRRT